MQTSSHQVIVPRPHIIKNKKKKSTRKIDIEHGKSLQPSHQQKDIETLIQALVRGNNKTYLEKVKLAFQSSLLFLPIFFVNGAIIFFESKEKIETAMRNNIYYKHYFYKFLQTFAYEGGVVSAEGAAITTPSVMLTSAITALTLGYQGRRYLLGMREKQPLITFLDKKNYEQASKIIPYALSQKQLSEIQQLLIMDDINEKTIIQATPGPLEKFVTDLLWFHDESNKYIAPLLLLSLIPGILQMVHVAKEIDADMHCRMFSLWSLLLDVCPPIQKAEVMSLLSYLWGYFSCTYLISHSLALVSRVMMSPFPNARQWFNQKINQPFSTWYGKDQYYEQFIEKSLLVTTLPLVVAYSLYKSIHFANAYLAETGCSDLTHALAKTVFSGKIYPCSTPQAALGASAFAGELEFDHLYPFYLALKTTTLITAAIVKRIPYCQQSSILEKVKNKLNQFAWLENKISIAVAVGALTGGLFGLWPSFKTANAILRKEGFELFFTLKSLLQINVTLPDMLPNQSIPLLNDLLRHIPTCTINSSLIIPDVIIGNRTIPGFNLSIPCIETLYDENHSIILGLQVTAPCSNISMPSAFYHNLFHLPINCNPILIARSFASYVVLYELSVSIAAGLSTGLTATGLLAFWGFKKVRNHFQQPTATTVNNDRTKSKRRASPHFFNQEHKQEPETIEMGVLTQPLPTEESHSDEEEPDHVANPSRYSRPRQNCCTRFLNNISQFFFGRTRTARERNDQIPLLQRNLKASRAT